MKIIKRNIFLIAILIYLPTQSMAWGMLGHRIVGQIAETYLKNKTRKEIKKILGNESLAIASNWADFIKSDPAYNYISNWHYINLPAGLTEDKIYNLISQDTAVNVYTRINFLATELKKKSLSLDEKRMYLRLLVHFVGDLHQPMHTGRVDDLGGNKVQLTWFGQQTNLHRVWDSDMIDSQELSYSEYARAINFIERYQVQELQNESTEKWVYDSYLVSEKIYGTVKSGDKLSYRYTYDNIAIAEKQMLKGGVRLAGILNSIFAN